MLLQSAARLGAPENSLRAIKQKLLEPLGCQELSEPICKIGPVMANSIAACLNSEESVSRAPRLRNESSFPSAEMETVAKLSGELPGIVPVRAAKRVGIIEEVARTVDVLRGE